MNAAVPTTLTILALLVIPGATVFAQVDMDGHKLTTQVRVGTDEYRDSRGRRSYVQSVNVTRRVSDDFTIEAVANGGRYFGSDFTGGGGTLWWKPSTTSYLQFGGLRNSSTMTTHVWAATIEAGGLLYKSKKRDRALKAVEASFTQTWKGYDAALQTSVAVSTPRVVLYFPAGFDLTLQANVVDLVEAGAHHVAPGGGARIHVSPAQRVELMALAGFDSEGNTSIAPTLGLSGRSYGGGAKVWLNRTTSVEGFVVQSTYSISRSTGTTYGALFLRRF